MYYVMTIDNGECFIYAIKETRKEAERIATKHWRECIVRERPYHMEWHDFLEETMESAKT